MSHSILDNVGPFENGGMPAEYIGQGGGARDLPDGSSGDMYRTARQILHGYIVATLKDLHTLYVCITT